MKSKSQALTEVAMKMGQKIYEQEQAAGPPEDAGDATDSAEEEVVDAEFSEVDDEKKD